MKRMRDSVGRPSMEHRISYPEIAERIQGLMSKRGLSRRDMVRALGCTDATFGNYYNGWRWPGKYAGKIADMLGITVDYLLYGKGAAPNIIEVIKSPLDSHEIETLQYLLDKLRSTP